MFTDFTKTDKYRLWLAAECPNSSMMNVLLDKYGPADCIYSDIKLISSIKTQGVSAQTLNKLAETDPDKLYDKLLKSVVKNNIDVLIYGDLYYPAKLTACPNAPSVIFTRGKPILNNICTVGVVGTRKYSPHGAELTDLFSYYIASRNACIVSGMALGIDTLAARSALRVDKNYYPTIAVLGSGVDMPTPSENQALYERIIERGTVVSQFMPGTHPTKYTYPMRNSVIAGLSDCLLIIEAGIKSGALITANAAIKYGKPVYAIPARVTDESFRGSNRLLKEGKALYADDAKEFSDTVCAGHDGGIEYMSTEQVDDIQDFMKLPISDFIESEISKIDEKCEKIYDSLDTDSKKIYNALVEGDMDLDMLAEKTGLSQQKLNHLLTVLEIDGIVTQSFGRTYHLCIRSRMSDA